MKIITVVAQQVSAEALATALPAEGVRAVTVTETQSFSRQATAVQSYRGVKIGNHFPPVFRIEIAVDDDSTDQVVSGIAFARSAGLLGDAQAWVSGQSDDLFAASGAGGRGATAADRVRMR